MHRRSSLKFKTILFLDYVFVAIHIFIVFLFTFLSFSSFFSLQKKKTKIYIQVGSRAAVVAAENQISYLDNRIQSKEHSIKYPIFPNKIRFPKTSRRLPQVSRQLNTTIIHFKLCILALQ